MTHRDQVYKCNKCGNLINVVCGGGGVLICCNEPMQVMQPNTVDAAQEKHVPVVTRNGNTVTVSVGSVPHPMEDKHYIQTISVLTADRLYRAYLEPGQKPEAVFEIEGELNLARAYCNLHGLWQNS